MLGQDQNDSGLIFTVSNSSSYANVSDWNQLQSFQNEYRYYIPVDPPTQAKYLFVRKNSSGLMILCEVRIYIKGEYHEKYLFLKVNVKDS